MVAVVQLAITIGATIGGLIYDTSGYPLTFSLSAGLLAAAAVMAELTRRLARKSCSK